MWMTQWACEKCWSDMVTQPRLKFQKPNTYTHTHNWNQWQRGNQSARWLLLHMSVKNISTSGSQGVQESQENSIFSLKKACMGGSLLVVSKTVRNVAAWTFNVLLTKSYMGGTWLMGSKRVRKMAARAEPKEPSVLSQGDCVITLAVSKLLAW